MGQTMNKSDALFEELFVQCETADRLSDELCSKLEKLSETKRQQLVSRMKKYTTPLYIASKRGVLDIVRYLQEKCKADANQFCKCYGKRGPEMTPLMEAQNVDVARCLMEHGAKYMPSILTFHISNLRLDVADFLVSQGVDINDDLEEEDFTCLDWAEDDPHLYELLLKYGANVNVYNDDQESPLDIAVQEDKLWKVQQLLKYGADPKHTNVHGDNALQIAGHCFHKDIFNYLMDNVDYSDVIKANAHELMGAKYANCSNYEILQCNPKIIKHWKKALKIRLNNGGPFLERELINQSLISDVREFRTIRDLRRIINSPRSIILQVLLINYRICKYDDDDAFKYLHNAYKTFNKKCQFEDALHFIMRLIFYLFETDDDVESRPRETALEATAVIINIAENNGIEDMSNHFNDVLVIAHFICTELFDSTIEDDVQIALMSMLYVLLKMPKSEDELIRLKRLINKIIQYSDEKNRIILHMVASIKDALCIRCVEPLNKDAQSECSDDDDPLVDIQLLLKCGYHVDALDFAGLLTMTLSVSKECDEDLVNCLLEHEAHFDRFNSVRIRQCHLVDTVPDFKTFKYVTLECLAARTIAKHKMPYKHLNIHALDAFIEMH